MIRNLVVFVYKAYADGLTRNVRVFLGALCSGSRDGFGFSRAGAMGTTPGVGRYFRDPVGFSGGF